MKNWIENSFIYNINMQFTLWYLQLKNALRHALRYVLSYATFSSEFSSDSS